MASTEPPPAPGDTGPDPRWQLSLRDPYPADPQRADRAPYTDTTGPSRPPAQPAALEAAAAVQRATPPAAARIPR